MARLFTTDEQALLRSPNLAINVLLTFFLDEGTYRFCDDHIDLNDGTNTWIGASAVGSVDDIRSGQALAAESVTITLDGNRMAQAGIDDPAKVIAQTLDYLYVQRRVDIAFGFRYNYSQEINLVVPAYAGKINTYKLVDPQYDLSSSQPVYSNLEMVLDALAVRYRRMTNRTRSHADQQAIDPTDMFYSFTNDAAYTEKTLFWGKQAPVGLTPTYPTNVVIPNPYGYRGV